jgi:hypothetical protein
MSRLEDPYRNDTYQELASIRANTQASVAFQALQTGLLAQMSGSMNDIHTEMANVRLQQSEALAIQQELLNREQIQSHLEEFIFQAEKLVAECLKNTTDIPASSRYFLLMGVLGKIEDDGIGTPIIKGRDNKSAFEKVVNDTKGLTQRLLKDPEVQEAIKWAEAERKRLDTERKQAERERQAEIKKLEQTLQSLRGQLRKISVLDAAKECWSDLKVKVAPRLPTWEKNKVGFIVMVCLAIMPGGAIAFWSSPFVIAYLFFKAQSRTAEVNRETNEHIASVVQQLSELGA